MMWGTVFDLEGDGLKPTKLHVMSATTDGTNIGSTPDYSKMAELLTTHEVLVGHNIIRYDIPCAESLLGVEISKETLLVDTLALSWYLSPNRSKHGLESYGEEYGVPKPKVDDWEGLSYEEYKHRCEEDVKINTRLWTEQYQHLREIYGSHDAVVAFLRYLAFKMDCAREQERSRWKLDVDRCKASLEKLEKLKEDKVVELRDAMPQQPVTAIRKPPKQLYKANGEPSAIGERWFELLDERGLPRDHREPLEVITGYVDPNPGSHDQIKQWLYSLGWEPETFKTNKKKEEVPQINRSKQDGGGICESIKRLYPKEPRLELLDNLFVLGHRIGILNGFLNAVSEDGYVVARIQGLTNTLRFKHAECVNLPKIDAPFGDDIRGCLIAPEGYELCGSDMSSLEDRLKQHFMWPYDPGYVKKMNVPGYDPHLTLAQFAKRITQKNIDEYKSGVYEPWIKTIRGIFKNGNYACQYGAFPPKIAKTVGGTLEEGKEIFDAYWGLNWSIKKVADACKTKEVRGSMWLFNPISKFWYSLRSDKDRFSTLVQGSGVYCFDTWVAIVRRDRPQLTGQFHDEIILCVKEGYREEISGWLKKTIEEVNQILRLDRELDIEVQFGSNYAQIH